MALRDYLEYRREQRASLENPATPLTVDNAEGWVLDGEGSITEKKALSIPAVWAAVDFLSSSLAGASAKGIQKERGRPRGIQRPLLPPAEPSTEPDTERV